MIHPMVSTLTPDGKLREHHYMNIDDAYEDWETAKQKYAAGLLTWCEFKTVAARVALGVKS